MIDHITIPVSDVEASKAFYQTALKPLGYTVAFGEEGRLWAFDIGDGGLFEIVKNQDHRPITPSHFAFRARSKAEVDSFYKAALDAGARGNGKPGPRALYSEGYYASFVIDLDGYNVEVMIDTGT